MNDTISRKIQSQNNERQPKSFCVTFGLPFVLIHSPRLMRSASAEESAELQEDDGKSESVDGE